MMDSANRELMLRVRNIAGPYLTAFAPFTSTPLGFWAALTANESGAWLVRNAHVPPRFEPRVLDRLVRLQQEPVASPAADRHAVHLDRLTPADLYGKPIFELRRLASSWGLTQVMGYHVIGWGKSVVDLINPATHYFLAAKLLADFLARYQLDPTRDHEAMARCWNTGRPDGQTFDPAYVPNLLARVAAWEQLPAEPPAAPTSR